MADITLTSEQIEFLAECEEEFQDRYTEKDNDFIKIQTQVPKEPPIVDPWYSKSRRPPYNSTHQYKNQNQREHNDHWNRRNNERNRRNEKWERHGGKHHMYNRQRMY